MDFEDVVMELLKKAEEAREKEMTITARDLEERAARLATVCQALYLKRILAVLDRIADNTATLHEETLFDKLERINNRH